MKHIRFRFDLYQILSVISCLRDANIVKKQYQRKKNMRFVLFWCFFSVILSYNKRIETVQASHNRYYMDLRWSVSSFDHTAAYSGSTKLRGQWSERFACSQTRYESDHRARGFRVDEPLYYRRPHHSWPKRETAFAGFSTLGKVRLFAAFTRQNLHFIGADFRIAGWSLSGVSQSETQFSVCHWFVGVKRHREQHSAGCADSLTCDPARHCQIRQMGYSAAHRHPFAGPSSSYWYQYAHSSQCVSARFIEYQLEKTLFQWSFGIATSSCFV